MTALRVTPISAAIWLQDRPEVTQLRNCSIRSAVQGEWLGEGAGDRVGTRVESGGGVVVVSSMERPHEMQRPVLGRDRAKAARNGCRGGPLVAATRIRCASAKYFVWKYRRRDHRAASALKRLQPAALNGTRTPD
jgi:hypothetical protein